MSWAYTQYVYRPLNSKSQIQYSVREVPERGIGCIFVSDLFAGSDFLTISIKNKNRRKAILTGLPRGDSFLGEGAARYKLRLT